MKKPILITAFDSFGGRNYNPTEKLLGMLPNEGIKKLLLPTSYSRAPELLRAAVKELFPAAVICLGLASGRSVISLEFAALNIKDSDVCCDNDGELASGQSVIPGAPNALFTGLDLGPYARIIRDAGVPCRVSYHAGTFVCNCVYYHLLSSASRAYSSISRTTGRPRRRPALLNSASRIRQKPFRSSPKS